MMCREHNAQHPTGKRSCLPVGCIFLCVQRRTSAAGACAIWGICPLLALGITLACQHSDRERRQVARLALPLPPTMRYHARLDSKRTARSKRGRSATDQGA